MITMIMKILLMKISRKVFIKADKLTKLYHKNIQIN